MDVPVRRTAYMKHPQHARTSHYNDFIITITKLFGLTYFQQHAIPSRDRCCMYVLFLDQVDYVATEGLLADLFAHPTYRSPLSMGIWSSHSDCTRHNRPSAPE
jgi:hypothetical protein